MHVASLKKHIGFISIHHSYGENKKEKICAVVGIDTPLFPLVSMLIKMNKINIKRKEKDNEAN